MGQDEGAASAVVVQPVTNQSGQIACRWCGLFSDPGPACDLCGSPLLDVPWLQVPQLMYRPADAAVDSPEIIPPAAPPEPHVVALAAPQPSTGQPPAPAEEAIQIGAPATPVLDVESEEAQRRALLGRLWPRGSGLEAGQEDTATGSIIDVGQTIAPPAELEELASQPKPRWWRRGRKDSESEEVAFEEARTESLPEIAEHVPLPPAAGDAPTPSEERASGGEKRSIIESVESLADLEDEAADEAALQERLRHEEEARVRAEELATLRAGEADRLKAEQEAVLKAELEARLRAEERARLRAEEEARLRAKAEEEARAKAEEEARAKAEEEARIRAEEEARLLAEEVARTKAEERARVEQARADERARASAAKEAKARAKEEARLRAEAEKAAAKAAEEARLRAEEEARLAAEEEARRRAEQARAEEEARRRAEQARADEEARLRAEAEEEARAKAAEEEDRFRAEEVVGAQDRGHSDDDGMRAALMQEMLGLGAEREVSKPAAAASASGASMGAPAWPDPATAPSTGIPSAPRSIPSSQPQQEEKKRSKLPWKKSKRKRGETEGAGHQATVPIGTSAVPRFQVPAVASSNGAVYEVPQAADPALAAPGAVFLVCSRCGQPSPGGGLCEACEDALSQLRQLTAALLDGGD